MSKYRRLPTHCNHPKIAQIPDPTGMNGSICAICGHLLHPEGKWFDSKEQKQWITHAIKKPQSKPKTEELRNRYDRWRMKGK